MALVVVFNMVIYLITNRINGMQYVGQTKYSAAFRFRKHCHPKSGGISYLKRAILKYNKDNFSHTVLSNCSNQEQLNDAERYWIDYYQTLAPNGYNLDLGGNNSNCGPGRAKKISEATKGRISWNKGTKGLQVAWNKGLKGIINSGSFKKGHKQSEESRMKMRLAKLGKSKKYG